MVGGHAEPGHENGLVGELVGPFGRGQDHGGGAVGLGAAVEQPQRPADGGRGEHLVDGDLVLEVGVGIEAPVVMVLHGHRRQHLRGGPELVHVPCGEGGEQYGGRLAPVVERVPGGGPRQQALLGRLVAHLLHPDDEHDIVHAARHHHGPDPEGVGSGGTGVLHPCAGDARQAQGARHGVPADPLLAPQGAALGGHDGGVDRPAVETLVDVGQRRIEGAGRHLLVALLEELAELDQARPHDGHLVPAHRPPPPAPSADPPMAPEVPLISGVPPVAVIRNAL